MCMRRNGTACETAHFMVPPVGVTENPSAAFQKVQVALFRGRVASECTLPAMWTLSGVEPNPQDNGIGPAHAYGVCELVDAGRKQQILSPG